MAKESSVRLDICAMVEGTFISVRNYLYRLMYVIIGGCIMWCFRDAPHYFAYVTTLNIQSSPMLTPEFLLRGSTGRCLRARTMASFSVGISVPVHSPVDTYNIVIKTNTHTIFSEWVVHWAEQLLSATETVNYVSFLILVINQLKVQLFIISLLYASTCFEHYVLIIRRSWIPTSSVSTCARDGHLQVWWYQMLYNIILTSWWWAQHCSKHVEAYNKLIITQFVH